MKIMNSEWRDRVRHWIRTLRQDLYEPLGEISWSAFCTMEHLSLEKVLRNQNSQGEVLMLQKERSARHAGRGV